LVQRGPDATVKPKQMQIDAAGFVVSICVSFSHDSSVNQCLQNVALLGKSGVRVAKWPMRTYNGAVRWLERLSALPRWTPQPHPIQCDDFEPRRPHGGAFDSGPIAGQSSIFAGGFVHAPATV
jgi:hypothetical protein